jgi:hypothetical protein
MTQQSSFPFVKSASLLLLAVNGCSGWVSPPSSLVASPGINNHFISTSSRLQNDRLNRDIEERSFRKAQGEGVGEMAAGAILGGLVLGPFGALFGAQIGSKFGSKNAASKARQEEMERLGVTQDMLDGAQEVGVALQQSMEGLEATKNSLQTHQSFARSLDREAEELYAKATEKITSGDEGTARTFLLKRTDVQEKLKKILKLCAEEKRRVETMEQNVETIQQRALEVEALLNRTVGAKARQESIADFSLEREDPLLKKFRDMGID